MVFTVILQYFVNVVAGILSTLPSATALPFGTDTILSSGVGYLRFFIVVFPPLGTLLTAFLVYIGFILALKIVRLIPIVRHIFD